MNASGIQDLAGNSGTSGTNITWQMILDTPPTPTNLVITPDLGISATDGLTSTESDYARRHGGWHESHDSHL
ncbi:MAG: hypothetical protein QM813_08935 [Verrucomicrobiota bacterium]